MLYVWFQGSYVILHLAESSDNHWKVPTTIKICHNGEAWIYDLQALVLNYIRYQPGWGN